MIKAFFRLWLLVFVPFIILIYPSPYNPVNHINEWMVKDRLVAGHQGTFYLIEEKLRQYPQQEWPERILDIASGFDYELKLLTLTSASEEVSDIELLRSGGYVVYDIPLTVLWRRIPESDWVISMLLQASEDQVTSSTASGTLNLLIDSFQRVEPREWPETVKKLQHNFGFPISLVTRDRLELSAEMAGRLVNEGFAWERDEQQRTVIYQQLPASPQIIRAGPIPLPGPITSLLAIILSIYIGSISLGMLIFVWPLWRDLNRLADSAAAFGGGYLDRRSEIGRRSAIARLAGSFNAMADQIEVMIREHRDLTNAIAHDLRTPLSRLSFAFEMLESEGVGEADKLRYSQSIASGIDTLDHLIQQVLALSRYSRAIDIANFCDCKLAALLQEEINQQQIEHPLFRLKILVSEELQGRDVFVDQRAMVRVLDNLVANALRYADAIILVTLSVVNDMYQLTVEDDGPGIAKQDREAIFMPFSQLDNAQREASSEHGLGLAIVQQIAIWHKGSVEVSDSLLGGARFDIRWPHEYK